MIELSAKGCVTSKSANLNTQAQDNDKAILFHYKEKVKTKSVAMAIKRN
jgi:hypothetical protein